MTVWDEASLIRSGTSGRGAKPISVKGKKAALVSHDGENLAVDTCEKYAVC